MRIRSINDAPLRPGGAYVLYWMIAARRLTWSFALDHALDRARELGVPLVIFEPLRCDYPWASDRLHQFVIDGMRDTARRLERSGVAYYPYLEPRRGAGSGLLAALARRAALVVTDRFPCFFLPRMVAAAGAALDVAAVEVDGNGLYPLDATDRVFTTAASFRRHLQKELPAHLGDAPRRRPLAGYDLGRASIDPSILARWPRVDLDAVDLAALPIDHAVRPVARGGGATEAVRTLRRFIRDRLALYATSRNEPEADAQSHLSPYLHFGHISAHQVFAEVTAVDDWSPERIADRPSGSRRGWWGASEAVESFLDELITWREIGFNMCAHRDDYAELGSLPDWALATLGEHAGDPRPYLYAPAQLDAAETHDALWNAAQRQLVEEGVIHNYLRMLWGKKILEWSPSARQALDVMVELNNKYAVDGRDPNSYSGIFWVLGRYDRAWGPEREIFGKVRYMSSENTARKIKVRDYIARYRGAGA